MDTDPNPFRESPDSDRSSASTEAPDSRARDFVEADEQSGGTSGSSPMSEEESGGATKSDADTSGNSNSTIDAAVPTAPNANQPM